MYQNELRLQKGRVGNNDSPLVAVAGVLSHPAGLTNALKARLSCRIFATPQVRTPVFREA